MRLKKLHIIVFFLLIWSFSFAQEYTNYSIKNGLPSNHVYRITQDYNGFIWFITDKGISKFDGKTFKNFIIKDGLPSNDVWQIKITPDNKIWFFSKSNKLGYIFNDKVRSFGSKNNNVFFPRTILQSQNTIYFNNGNNLNLLKDSIWISLTNPHCKKTNLDKQKVIHSIINYHGIDKNNVYFYKKNNIKVFPIKKGIYNTISEHGQINDSLYSSTSKKHYVIENFNSEKVYTIPYTSQGLSENLKHFRLHNVNNHIQVTGMNFVSSLGRKGILNNLIHIPKKLNSHFSFIDRIGNIWSATFNKGVFLLPKEKQHTKILAENKKIQHLKLINNNLYASIYKEGFFKINNTIHPIIKNNCFQYSISNLKKSNTIIFSSEYHLYKYKNNETAVIKNKEMVSFKNTLARKIINYKDFLYGNNAFGFSKINPSNFNIIKQYQLYGINSFSKTKNNLFIANPSGLYILKNDSVKKLQSKEIFNKPILMQANYTDSKIIVGTDGNGAYITDGKTVSFIKNSSNLSVQSTFVDSKKNIWLATSKGVHKVIKEHNKYKIRQSFYESDGLISNKINSIVIKRDSLYAATDIGISVLPLLKEEINQLQKLYIKSITVNNQKFKGDSIQFPYKNNNILSISFGAINFSNQQNLKYQYSLNPIQKKWTATSTPQINFNDLQPNTYLLKLKVINHHKKERNKTILIKITPLWYQTWSFKILIFIIICITLFYFDKWSRKKILEQVTKEGQAQQKAAEHELHALRSQMNPHFVFNSLNAIQYYMTKNRLDLSEKYLIKFSRLIRMFFDSSGEQFITLEQEIQLLKSYLEIEKMRFEEDFEFHFIIDKSINLDTKIPTMLLQPIVENAVNHGIFHLKAKGVIEITIKNAGIKNEFIIIIKDNGIGIKMAKEIKANSIKKHVSKSTKIIIDRIALINQSLEWFITQETIDLTNKNKSGTAVILTFKKIKNDESNISR